MKNINPHKIYIPIVVGLIIYAIVSSDRFFFVNKDGVIGANFIYSKVSKE